MSRITHLSLASLRGLSVSTIINQLILKALLKESYEKEKLTSIFILLMQSYGEFGQIPRNILKSSPTCVDNGTNFGQIAETGPKVVQRIVFLVIIWKFQKNFLSLHHDYARGDAHSMTEDR